MATESELKTSAERFLARVKEFAWLGAAAETKEDWDKQVAKFRNLYWGQLVLVESEKVQKAMIGLNQQIMETPDFSERDSLRYKVFEVSSALREQIRERNANEWRIDLPSLAYEH